MTHMGQAAGIAGSHGPEVEGIFLADSLAEAFWFASFGVHAVVDVWIVDTEGLRLTEQSGWVHVLPRLDLARKDST